MLMSQMLLCLLARWVALGLAPSSCQPASVPADPPVTTRPATLRVALRTSDQPEAGDYWLRVPAGYAPGQKPAMIVLLHGTDDTAAQMIEFWGGRTMPVPVLLAAPQGHGKGWSEADLDTVRAMWADLHARFSFDEQRVLLAGFSAGGAMTFELIYKEKLPVTAGAALANYVPPRLTAAEVTARAQIPIFYAVGMSDLNHERMRQGLDFLRSAGAAINLHRPRIGHTLDSGVAQMALDWFFERSRQDVDVAIEKAAVCADVASSVVYLEGLVAQARWHEGAVTAKATEVLTHREAPGRSELRDAEGLVTASRPVDAVELLRKIESAYGRGRLGGEARNRREQIESDPNVRAEFARRESGRRADQAATLYSTAQRLVAQDRRPEAATCCRQIISRYGDTPAAERAKRLLRLLQNRSTP